MGRRDVKSRVDMDISLAQTGDRTSDATGSSSDVSEYHGASILLNVESYTDGTHDFTIQESDDDSNWSDVATSDLEGSLPSVTESADEGEHRVGYTGNAQYLRVTTSVSGTTTGAEYGVYVLKAYPTQFPV